MRRKSILTLLGSAAFFLMTAVIVTVTMFVYAWASEKTGGNRGLLALVMLIAVIFLSALCTVIDLFRRKLKVDRPVSEILSATERIASGDFSVSIEPRHKSVGQYDEYDIIAENLNIMAETLSKSEMLKSDFISNISHELKTPLAVIQNYAVILGSKSITEEERREYINILISASKRLTSLVNNILKLNKLERGGISETQEKIKFDDLIAEGLLIYENRIEEKNIEITCDVDDSEMYAVRSYIEIIVNNLISNAVKFTPQNGRVDIKMKRVEREVIFSVTDSGEGISPELCGRIFDKFYQKDTSHSSEGNGLGLALVKRVLDIIGGEIKVASEEGQGASFVVTVRDEKYEK